MPHRPGTKRSAPTPTRQLKRQKLDGSKASVHKQDRPKAHKGKKKASERTTIDIPSSKGVIELSDQDADVIEEFGGAVSFLTNLNEQGISRSQKEIKRLHALNKPKRAIQRDDDLPSVDSASEDGSETDSQQYSDFDGVQQSEQGESENEDEIGWNSDEEMPYERAPRIKKKYWEPEANKNIPRLPIKLLDGRIQEVNGRSMPSADDQVSDDSGEIRESTLSHEEERTNEPRPQVEDVATGARFGRSAVIDVVQTKSRTARIEVAKEQIAGICQEITADPENSLGLLRRLHTFSLSEIMTPMHPNPVPNDPVIRRLAILSQLAVFMDIIPGFRIRALTDKEKGEKVSQMVAKTRDWEQGLVLVYQTYLKGLESELKARSDLSDAALQCMCALLSERTHFNFRVNLISCIVARLSKKNLDKSANLCLETIIKLFRSDITGQQSLEVVQVMNRMIKERHFKVHPEALSCLLHLRLKTELGVRSSDTKSDKTNDPSSAQTPRQRREGKKTDQPHMSKTAKKVLKERREIEKEFREAEAEVDKEEKAKTQTETLKLLFVLYFSILKNSTPTPLLPAALQGISKFAHLVNIDFFKDLINVLKELIQKSAADESVPEDSTQVIRDIHHRLLCIVTAFELLSGQGEALTIELSEFITQLYKLIPPLSHHSGIDLPSPFCDRVKDSDAMTSLTSNSTRRQSQQQPSVADMLFRALNIVFSPQTFGTASPPWCSAAFCKRLLIASLHWPVGVTLRTLEFVGGLIAKSSKLEVMLSTEDRSFDGIYRPSVDDPQVSNPFGTMFWELHLLSRQYYHPDVRAEASRLLNYVRS